MRDDHLSRGSECDAKHYEYEWKKREAIHEGLLQAELTANSHTSDAGAPIVPGNDEFSTWKQRVGETVNYLWTY